MRLTTPNWSIGRRLRTERQRQGPVAPAIDSRRTARLAAADVLSSLQFRAALPSHQHGSVHHRLQARLQRRLPPPEPSRPSPGPAMQPLALAARLHGAQSYRTRSQTSNRAQQLHPVPLAAPLPLHRPRLPTSTEAAEQPQLGRRRLLGIVPLPLLFLPWSGCDQGGSYSTGGPRGGSRRRGRGPALVGGVPPPGPLHPSCASPRCSQASRARLERTARSFTSLQRRQRRGAGQLLEACLPACSAPCASGISPIPCPHPASCRFVEQQRQRQQPQPSSQPQQQQPAPQQAQEALRPAAATEREERATLLKEQAAYERQALAAEQQQRTRAFVDSMWQSLE